MARAAPSGHTVTLAIAGPLEREQLPALFTRTCRLLAGSSAQVLCCELDGSVGADAAVVDALARLAVVARRHGVAVRLRGASQELIGLVSLMGLEGVLRVEPRR